MAITEYIEGTPIEEKLGDYVIKPFNEQPQDKMQGPTV